MSFWEGWKERITWLPDFLMTPLGAVWDNARQWPLASVIGVAVVALPVYYYKTPIWDALNRTEDGKIIVNSPTVYTRQRLVNDRLDQARWLRTQLELTENDHSKDFKNIDRIRRQLITTQVGFSNSQSEAPSRTSDDAAKKVPEDDIAVEATTMALFRAKNAYRDEVRAEITQTELDDRHDIRGNTIFRLTFDASVIAGTRKDSVAAIAIRLSHNPEAALDRNVSKEAEKRLTYAQDYEGLYVDWARYFQKTIGISMKAMPASLYSAEPQARLRLLFTEFLIGRICDFVESKGEFKLSDAPSLCTGEKRKKAEELLRDYTRKRLELLSQSKDALFLETLRIFQAQKEKYEFPPIALSQILENASALCAQSNRLQISLWELNVKQAKPLSQSARQPPSGNSPPLSQETTTEGKDRSESRTNSKAAPTERQEGQARKVQPDQTAPEDGTGQANQTAPATDVVGCPFYPSLQERLLAGVLLYENLYSIVRQTERNFGKERPLAGDYSAFADRAATELTGCQFGACFVEPARLSCFAADFIRSEQNAFYDPTASDVKKISNYLTLKIIGREVNDCTILVLPVPTALDGEPDPGRSKFKLFLRKFVGDLNQGTDAFAYSVTPKNLTENIATASETRDAFELLFRTRGDKSEVADFLRKRSEQNRALVAHPIVVGFGSPNYARVIGGAGQATGPASAGVRDIEFGWIVAGRMADGSKLEQIDGQYTLTSFISVPGWWRTVEASIRTCWISRSAPAQLGSTTSANNLCPENSGNPDTQTIMVRLPSAIPEISRKLEFDLLQEPSLYNYEAKELVVGTKGSLLLEGARLWRSTEVTAGAQHADKITVLPNMEGILAEFKCVLPPAGKRHERRNSSVPKDDHQIVTGGYTAQVWTSEGVTDRVPIVFVWPENWDKLLADCLYPPQRPTAAKPPLPSPQKP